MKKSIVSGTCGVVASLAVALSFIGNNGNLVDCTYSVSDITTLSKKFVLEVPYERVPNATFYSLFFGDEEVGASPFGEGYSVVAGALLFNPIDRLSVAVYDSSRNVIGVGRLSKGGRVKVKFNEGEVVSQ